MSRRLAIAALAGGGAAGDPGIDAWVNSGAVSDRGGGVDDFCAMVEGRTGEVLASSYDRYFHSTDGGQSFTRYTVTGASYEMAYSPIADRYVAWRYNSTGIWYSDDGLTWTQSNVTTGINGDVRYVPFLGEFIAFRFNGQPRYSADGITWSAEVASSFVRSTTRCYVGETEMIFSGSPPDINRRSVGKLSTDFSTMTGLGFEFHAAWCGSFGWRAFSIGAGQQLYQSTNNAVSWSGMGNVLPSNQVWQGIAFDPSRERLWIVGNNGAVHYSDDGGSTWSADVASGDSPTFALLPYVEWNHMVYFPNADQLWSGTDNLVHSP